MRTIGILMIVGVLLWVFMVTLPFLWWLWVLIFGVIFYKIGTSKKEKVNKEEDVDIKNLG